MRRFVLVLLVVLTGLVAAQPVAAQEPSSGGFLFVYRPHPGERPAFVEGYRRHLDWHEEKDDSLSWFGWDVLVGREPGLFVDGVFGVPFAALDERVDPAGDRADAAANVLRYADPVSRELIALRRDLSTATPLSAGTPSRMVQVVRYAIGPGGAALVESGLRALRAGASEDSLLPYTVYERVAGASPGFVLMIWRDRLGSFDAHGRNPERVLRRLLAERADPAGGPFDRVASEVWLYRPDLTRLGSGHGGG